MYKNASGRIGHSRFPLSLAWPVAAAGTALAVAGVVIFGGLLGTGHKAPTSRPVRPIAPAYLGTPLTAVAYAPMQAKVMALSADGSTLGYSAPPRAKLGPDAFAGGAVAVAAPAGVAGYYVATATGQVYPYGAAGWRGSPAALGKVPAGGVVGLAALGAGRGYYVLGAGGQVMGFGARAWPSRGLPAGAAAVGIALAAGGSGYYVATSTGAVLAYGAKWHGDASPSQLSAPVVGIAVDASTGGYWLALADGQVLGFGAPGGNPLGCPRGAESVSGIAPTPSGYVLATSSGRTIPVQASRARRALPNAAPSPACVAAWRLRSSIGFYPGTGVGAATVSKLRRLEGRIGAPVNYVTEFLDQRSPSKLSGSAWGLLSAPGGLQSLSPKPRLVLSVPLGFSPASGGVTASSVRANFAAVSSGRYDSNYRYVAHLLLEAGYPNAIIRVGWEFNGNWFPWSASYDPAGFKAAYRHVVGVFRSVSPTFRYDLSASSGVPANWSRYWPGSRYVDMVGLDVYDMGLRVPYDPLSGTWVSPAAAWGVSKSYLDAMESFALAKHEVVSLPEWGLSTGGSQSSLSHGGDDPTFVQGVAKWIAAAPPAGPGSVAFADYFNASVPSEGSFELTSFPRSSALFYSLFGVPR